MNLESWGPIAISIIGALSGFYGLWLGRHKARAEARKIEEEAQSEDARQRGTEIGNLNTIIEQWQNQYGLLVQRMNDLKAELDCEIERRKGVEASSAQLIAELEQQLANERNARIAEEKRAQRQAQHLISLQEEMTAVKAENSEMRAAMQQMQGTIDSQDATISSLQQVVAEKDRQIVSLRQDLSAMQLEQKKAEVQARVKRNGT